MHRRPDWKVQFQKKIANLKNHHSVARRIDKAASLLFSLSIFKTGITFFGQRMRIWKLEEKFEKNEGSYIFQELKPIPTPQAFIMLLELQCRRNYRVQHPWHIQKDLEEEVLFLKTNCKLTWISKSTPISELSRTATSLLSGMIEGKCIFSRGRIVSSSDTSSDDGNVKVSIFFPEKANFQKFEGKIPNTCFKLPVDVSQLVFCSFWGAFEGFVGEIGKIDRSQVQHAICTIENDQATKKRFLEKV